MSKLGKILATVGGGAVFVALMLYLTMSPGQVSCEVCMEFHGQTECRRSVGKDKEEAQMSATATACGLISGGVTEVIACQNTQPKSVSCQAR